MNSMRISKKDMLSGATALKLERFSKLVGLDGVVVIFDENSESYRVAHRGVHEWCAYPEDVIRHISELARVWVSYNR